MSVNQNPDYKMRIITGYQPTEEEMDEALSEAAAIHMALDECDENDEVERAELESAYREAIKRVRLNLYRLGKDPSDG
jgi:hypothetical protein